MIEYPRPGSDLPLSTEKVYVEQSSDEIDEIRGGIAEIYELQEVKEAVYDHWTGKANPRSVEVFRDHGIVTIRKGVYQFALHPGINDKSDGLVPLTFSRLELDGEGNYRLGTRRFTDASSRDRISGIKTFESMSMDCEVKLKGNQAIELARDLIRSFHNPNPQENLEA